MISNHTTEILILGGGIAGCIAAIALSDIYKVTLVDKLEHPIDKVGESLAPATQRIFNVLGLSLKDPEYDKIYLDNLGMQSYWGSEQVQIVDHLRNPDGLSKSVDRKKLACYLRKEAENKGISCFWGFRLYSNSYLEKTWEVTCKSDNKKKRSTVVFTTNFIIDATGRNAHFAKSIGIKRTTHDALISCWITLPNTDKNTMSTIISDEFGWWYSAVIPNKKRVISYQTDADIFDKSTFKNYHSFRKLLETNSTIRKYVHNKENQIEFHGVVSANSTKLNIASGKQWIALGDAALSFDPLSSQGMLNAMANAIQASELLRKFNIAKSYNSEKMETFSNIYTSQIESIWKHYIKHKNLFYSAESRWEKATFWNRRQQKAILA